MRGNHLNQGNWLIYTIRAALSSSDSVDPSYLRDVESSIELRGVPVDAYAVSGRGIRSVELSLSRSHILNLFVEFVAQNVIRLPSVLGGLEACAHESVSRLHFVVLSHV